MTSGAPLRRAIFMDRDGTVSDEVGYINHISRYRMLPRSIDAIRRLNDAGFMTFIVTNQAGIARGLFSEETLNEVHATLNRWVEAGGARLDGIYACTHHPKEGVPPWRQDCDCRKPRPGLLLQAAREHGIDLGASYMIGDTVLDMEAARNAGTTGVLVLTGYGRGDLTHRIRPKGIEPAHVAEDLFSAVDWILAQEGRR